MRALVALFLGLPHAAAAQVIKALDALETPVAYPSACFMDPLARQAAELTNRVLSKLNPAAVGDETIRRVSPIVTSAGDPTKTRDVAISRFVDRQLDRWKDFFDTVESMPLTPEQRLAVALILPVRAALTMPGAAHGGHLDVHQPLRCILD